MYVTYTQYAYSITNYPPHQPVNFTPMIQQQKGVFFAKIIFDMCRIGVYKRTRSRPPFHHKYDFYKIASVKNKINLISNLTDNFQIRKLTTVEHVSNVEIDFSV